MASSDKSGGAVGQSGVEIKHPGSVTDFSNTWWASVPLPGAESERIVAWCAANIPTAYLAEPSKGCKGGCETTHHLNLLMGIPAAPSSEFVRILGSVVDEFMLEFGALDTFEGAAGDADVYRVLILRLADPAALARLQQLVARMCVAYDQPPLAWHHPVYNPHITVAWIKSAAAGRYVGRRVFGPDADADAEKSQKALAETAATTLTAPADSESPPSSSSSSASVWVDKIVFKKYKSSEVVTVPLRPRLP